MRAPSDASLEDKGRAKGKKGSKNKAGDGAAALQGFRKYTSPAGIQVRLSLHALLVQVQCASLVPASMATMLPAASTVACMLL